MSRKRPSEPFWGWRHGIPYPLPWKRPGGPFLRLCGGAERCCPRLFQNSGGTRQKMSPGKRPRGRRAKLIAGWADLRHQGPGNRALDLMPGIGEAPPGSKPTRARSMLHYPEPRAAARTPRRRSGGPRGAGDGDPGALGGPRSQEAGEDKRSDKQGPDTRTERRPRDPRPPRARPPNQQGRRPPKKDGERRREAPGAPCEGYGPEHIRGDGCRAGGHQRQEGGEPKPPQAEEQPTTEGGRRTGGQAAATAAAAPRQAAGGPRHRNLSSVRNKPPFANSCRPNFRPVGMGPAGREAKKQG